MKILLSESQLYFIIESQYADNYDLFELLNNTEFDIFFSIKNKQKVTFDLINPQQYKHALKEFMEFGKIIKFPERIIFDWKDLCLENIAKLSVLTEIHGHSSSFPFDVFWDTFNNLKPRKGKEYDFFYVYDILDRKYHIDDYVPFFSNGQPVLSDFGLEPLMRLAVKLIEQTDVNHILVTINMIMDVAHQRSDLSELFLEGGQASHESISNT